MEGERGERGQRGTGEFRDQAVSDSVERIPKEQTQFISLDSGRVEVVGTVADIEDVYFEEDGSIQRIGAWKPSLIAMETRVGEKLWGRFKLFGKRYGHQEVDRRAVIGGRLGNVEIPQVPSAEEHR